MKIKNEIFQQPLSNLAILIRFRNTVKGKEKGSSKWSHFKNLAPTKTIKSYPTTSIRRFSFFGLLHISERKKLENKHDKWTWVCYTQLFEEFHFPWQTPQKNNSYFFLPIRHEIIHIFSIEDEHRFFFFFPFLNAEFQPKHHIVAEEYYIKYWKLDSQKKKKCNKKNEKWKELRKWVLEMVRNREMLPEREEKRRWDFVEEIGLDTHHTHCQFNKYLLRFDLLKWKRRPFSFSHVTFYQLPPFRVFFFLIKFFNTFVFF